MRRIPACVAAALACVLLAPAPAFAAADDPLICVETGEIYVTGVIRYDPPDPCIL